MDAVACPSTTVCVAVDQSGNVLYNTRPLHSKWSGRAWIDPKVPLTGISCPSITLCVAIDADGRVITSTKPTGGLHAWSKPIKVDSTTAPGGGSVGLRGISCPTPQLCIAVDGAQKGNIVVSTNPAGGASAWSLQPLAAGPLTSISCASTALCVAAGAERYVSTTPTAGGTAWKAAGAQLGGGIFSAIACPAVTACITIGYGNTSLGLVSATSRPTGNARGWKTVGVAAAPPVPGEGLLDAIACPTESLCVAIDGKDNSYASTTPIGGTWGVQTPIRPSSASYASAIACTAQFCMVVDSAGVETTAIVR